MKINSSPLKGPVSRPGDITRTSSSRAGSTGATAAASSVALSTTARHLANLSSADNDINPVKVSEIRAALADGTLKIDADRIADGLIESARELLKP